MMFFVSQKRFPAESGYTPSLKFRPPQSVPSDAGEHTVLESNVFPPVSSGRHKNQSKFSAGDTAIELLVVSSIMITISAIVLLGFGILNDSVALNRSARDLAVMLRRAQNMALAVTGVSAIGNEVPPAVGIQLTQGASTYLLFADRSGSFRDYKYGASDGELIQSLRFDRNVVAYQFLDVDGDPISPAEGVLHIIFSAPEADLRITDGNGNGDPKWAKVDIIFRSPSGKTKILTVRESGQISVK